MKLTNRTEYALLALAFLGRGYGGDTLQSGHEIAEHQEIPKRFLQQILFSLKKGGYVRSVKGPEGGYALARPPENITLAEVVRFFEGPLAATTSASKNFYQPSPIEREPGILKLFSRIRDETSQILEATTLADVIPPPRSRKRNHR